MSNPWFYFPGHADRLVELTLAKAEEVNNLLDIISTGFDAAYTSVATKIDATSADALFTTPAEVNLAISTTLVTTSSSSVYWYGSKSFTVEAGKSFGVGQRLRISDGTATNLMEGEITSYSGTSLVVGIDYSEGAGTFTSWTITVTGSRGSASLVAFSESYDSASPNNVVGASRFLATGGLSSIDTVLQPKGTGAVLAQRSDSTATGGNKRGANAVDLQTSRAAAANVASGLSSVIVGGASNTTSSQNGVVVGGSGNSATTGTNIFIGGGSSNSASGAYSTISGGANNTLTGQYSAISGGRASDRARKVLMSSVSQCRLGHWGCTEKLDGPASKPPMRQPTGHGVERLGRQRMQSSHPGQQLGLLLQDQHRRLEVRGHDCEVLDPRRAHPQGRERGGHRPCLRVDLKRRWRRLSCCVQYHALGGHNLRLPEGRCHRPGCCDDQLRG